MSLRSPVMRKKINMENKYFFGYYGNVFKTICRTQMLHVKIVG